MEHGYLGQFGSNGTSLKVVLFFRMEHSNGNSCSISSKPSLIPVSGLRGRFPVMRKLTIVITAVCGLFLNITFGEHAYV